ncbi:unnamed protein product, partial [Phaeothamnion confervicola]
MAALAAGLPGNATLEVLNVCGNAPGHAGKMALGLALLGASASRLKGFYCDEFAVAPGQRVLDLSFDPRRPPPRQQQPPQQQYQQQQQQLQSRTGGGGGALSGAGGGGLAAGAGALGAAVGVTSGSSSPPPPPPGPAIQGEADACLLAGAIMPNRWLLSVSLDGCPLSPAHLKHLLRALLENVSIGTVSLQRCGMGGESARVLLELLAEKPGLEVLCDAGNAGIGEDRAKRLQAAQAHRTALQTEAVTATRMKLHLLGHPGVGKTTLRKALGRSYWSSIMQGSEERAEDLKLEDTSQRTRGVLVEELALNDRTLSVWDYGGLGSFRQLHGLNLLSSPNSMFVVVVSLMSPRAEQKRQVKYWLRLIQSCMAALGTVIVLVGSRADQLGAVGGDYLTKLWDSVRDELTQEEQGAGVVAALPAFQTSFALDCRKSQEPAMFALRDAVSAVQRNFEEGGHLLCPALFREMRRKVEFWRAAGVAVLPWAGFWQRVQRELYPRLSEGICVTVTRVLHHTGELLYVDRGTGRSWVFLSAGFLVDAVLGSIYASVQLPGGVNYDPESCCCSSGTGGSGGGSG